MNGASTEGRMRKAFKFLILLGVIGIVISVMMLYYMVDSASEEDRASAQSRRDIGYVLILLLGATSFAPLGLMLGWFFGDPFQRAKIRRSITKKNYGIVNFVSKGARIMSTIKNFDYDILFVGDGVWILERNKVYMQDKNDGIMGTKAVYPILPEHVNSVIGIPVIFLDVDTMRPLSFHKEAGEANPIDLASTMKGYIMNQLAKNMFFKRTFMLLIIIVIATSVLNLGLTYQVYDMASKYDEFLPRLQALADKVDASLTPPVPAPVPGG